MHTFDLVMGFVVVIVVLGFAAILARQRQILRTVGAVPMAVQRGQRWLYGIARYSGGELRWYRAIGLGTRATKVLRRGEIDVLSRRSPTETELRSLPEGAVIVRCRIDGETMVFAVGDSAYTGLVSWLESSAPR